LADKQTVTYETKFTLNYADDDTRTITIKNAKPITSSQAETVRSAIDAYGAITVGDKTGAAFVSSSNCRYIQQAVAELDIFNNNT